LFAYAMGGTPADRNGRRRKGDNKRGGGHDRVWEREKKKSKTPGESGLKFFGVLPQEEKKGRGWKEKES